jgi:DNA-binding transcriptional regulator YhcF (GntR family)
MLSSNVSGNRCNHDPLFPKFFERSKYSKSTYDILHQAMESIKDYYDNPKNHLERIFYSRESDRRQRSESREAVSLVSQVIFDHLDLASMQVVKYTKDGELIPMSVNQIAHEAGISERRAYRALDVFKKAGYIEFEYRNKKAGDEIIALRSIKRVSMLIFEHLGIARDKVAKCITYARGQAEKLVKRVSKEMKKVEYKAKDMLNSLKKTKGDGLAGVVRNVANLFKPASDAQIDRRRRLNVIYSQIQQEHPDWDAKQIKEEAKKRSPELAFEIVW